MSIIRFSLVCTLAAFTAATVAAAEEQVTPTSAIDIVGVDIQKRENCMRHNTCNYKQMWSFRSTPSIVLRRGQSFHVTVLLKRPYSSANDKFFIEFLYGLAPKQAAGTLINIPVLNQVNSDIANDSEDTWNAHIFNTSQQKKTLKFNVSLPVQAPIGVWVLKIRSSLAVSSNSSSTPFASKTIRVRESIYILFNAWSTGDDVYLVDNNARAEYLLNEVGKIYIGTYYRPMGRKWTYGQFQESVLQGVMMLLERSRLTIEDRTSAVKVSRAVGAVVNSHDDYGLLVGNWSGNYGDETAPWTWTSSVPILERYQMRGQSVKFGQCWVFAGVATTALRTLGIPARTVTNFVSAHDTDDSLTVDEFFSERGDKITGINGDSIWNFHVWSDAWMNRPDLPLGFDGWQTIDGTPQETSMGMYQVGPASVEAVKQGRVDFAYDTGFVFAEVNADVVHWKLDNRRGSQWRKISSDNSRVGKSMYTKSIGYIDDFTAYKISDAQNIVDNYKFRENTEYERAAVRTAARAGGLSFFFENF